MMLMRLAHEELWLDVGWHHNPLPGVFSSPEMSGPGREVRMMHGILHCGLLEDRRLVNDSTDIDETDHTRLGERHIGDHR